MSDKRKLQGEIDRCLKKVQEGVETFEDIWQKVYNSANANQKEKYEADLKKEIKKLQRQRDQIKTWLASSDIKDKRTLIDNRKLIETQMERFKVVERETKTKAYSKEGLGAASKLDPQAKEKQEITNWVSTQIENLKIQSDRCESELEQLTIGNKKKKMDKESEKFDSLKTSQDKHNFHINKLETVMRMVDNDAIPLEQIKSIKDDIEYYVESNGDPDFEDNEFVYDELELDDIDQVLLPPTSPPHDEDRFSDKLSTTPTSTNSSSPSPSPGIGLNHSKDDERKKYKSIEDAKNKNNNATSSPSSSSISTKMPSTPTKLSNSQSNDTNSNHLPNASSSSSHGWLDGQNGSNSGSPIPSRIQNTVIPPSVWQRPPSTTGTPVLRQLSFTDLASQPSDSKSQSNVITNHVSGFTSVGGISGSVLVNSVMSSSLNSSINSVSNNSSSVVNPSNQTSEAPLLNNGLGKDSPSLSPISVMPLRVTASTPNALNSNNNSLKTSLQSSLPSSQAVSQAVITMNSLSASKSDLMPVVMNGPLSAGSVLQNDKDALSESMSSLKSIARQAVMNAGLAGPENQSQSASEPSDNKVPFPSAVSQLTGDQLSPGSQDGSLSGQPVPPTKSIQLSRLQGVAPLGPVPLGKDNIFQLVMSDSGFVHLPHPSDSERLRHHLPRNPCPTPSYYPQTPPPHADSVEFFQRLSTETLFFIFYYMEGTKAQYLAAKALKKQSWRFHTKYMMWFQRHEEPKTINEDYEQGTYIYFDYEKWGQRKKEGFTFEYRYLEDRDLN
ncbi:CCR4-NOT transcription complex subunit 3-like isoform X2 [Mya arenaria]|uniref:CCR4-NOT transcription complex subunit 3-like isoform X2 n=1 Tax=Mya arenaria TaxID=6604 RepID=UPI0022E83174|nr:CCR4-NOT transcription complex subunit 3-like isoform X2 [Mya arenaria]